jgi:hypothetical protein
MSDVLISSILSNFQVSLFSDDVIEWTDRDGRKTVFAPDETKGFFRFTMSHVFPVATFYGTALNAPVVERSYRSLLYQSLNYEHQMAAYYKEPGKANYVEDRILGSVVAVDFPRSPVGGWKLVPEGETPGITGVASFAKLATAINRVVGDHKTGRHSYTVSMEVQYPFEEAGFALKLNSKKPEFASSTPDDFSRAGYEYVPFKQAPELLVATFSKKKNRIVARYKGRESRLLMGGLDGEVHYCGMGLVKYGAEKTAAITRMAASHPAHAAWAGLIAEPFLSLPGLLGAALKNPL